MRDRLLGLPVVDIVDRIRANDQRLYEALFTAYWGPLYRVAFAMLRDQVAAEEVVASVLVTVWERRATWDIQESLEGWFGNAVRNQVRMRWRSATRQQQLTQQYVAPGESPAMGSIAAPDANENIDLDRLFALDIAVQALPERYQAIVRYRWYEQRGYDEIAQFMGISAGTARNLASQALTLLRATLHK